MNNSLALTPTNSDAELNVSIERWTHVSTDQTLARFKDIARDKARAVNSFFALIKREPDEVTSQDVRSWRQSMIDKNLSERYIYASLAHLSGYFSWLMTTELASFIKVNPVRGAMPKPPKKYNSPRAKSLTDEELTRLWLYVESTLR